MERNRILQGLGNLVLIIAIVIGGCTKSKSTGPTGRTEVKAAMVTDIGGIGDKSFNDGSAEGLRMAQRELGVPMQIVESKQQTDYVPNLAGLAGDGFTIVFAVGFLMADSLVEAAHNNPNTLFAGIDIAIDPATAPKNVLGLQFREQESGYLAGIVAGLMTKQHASAIPGKLNDQNVVGMVLGMDIPPVERYQAGFYAGVKAVNPDCKVISVITGSFTDPGKGKEAAIAMIEQGADIIFQIAGLTGLGAINAARDNKVLAIGVDVDQFSFAADTVLTSALKGITRATFLTIKSVKDGTFKGGENRVFGIKDDTSGIASFHEFEGVVPEEVKQTVQKAIADLKSGAVTAPASRKEAGLEL